MTKNTVKQHIIKKIQDKLKAQKAGLPFTPDSSPLVFSPTQTKKFVNVWHIQNDDNETPFTTNPEGWLGVTEEQLPDTPEHINCKIGFQTEQDLRAHYSPEELNRYLSMGFKPTETKAMTVWGHSNPLIFEPFDKVKLDAMFPKPQMAKSEELAKTPNEEPQPDLREHRLNAQKPNEKAVHTEDLGNGMYHHVLKQGTGTFRHLLSTTPEADSTYGHVAQIVGKKVQNRNSGEKFLQVLNSNVPEQHAGNGYGKQLYGLAAKHHGALISDKIVSPDARKAYESYNNHPDYKVDIGKIITGEPSQDDMDELGHEKAHYGSPHVLRYSPKPEGAAAKSKLAAGEAELDAPDLEKDEFDIKQPHSIFSVENSPYPDKVKNPMTHEQAITHLRNQGENAHSVEGHYGSPERSIMVFNPKNPKALDDMAHQHGQESIIHSTGTNHEMKFLHGPQAGTSIFGSGSQIHKEKPSDFFTTLPNGQHFTHNFGKSEPLGKDDENDLTHYSSQQGLKELHPEMMGSSGISGAQYKRGVPENKSTFYYSHGSAPEPQVLNHAKSKYTAKVDSSHKIYDMSSGDPEGHVKAATEANQGAWNEDKFHGHLKSKGYHGVKWKMRDGTDVVQMYHPLAVHSEEPVEHAAKSEKSEESSEQKYADKWPFVKDELSKAEIFDPLDNEYLKPHFSHAYSRGQRLQTIQDSEAFRQPDRIVHNILVRSGQDPNPRVLLNNESPEEQLKAALINNGTMNYSPTLGFNIKKKRE